MKKGGTDGGRESRRKGRREGRKGGSDRRGLRRREGARGREGGGGGEKDGKEDQEEKSNEELASTVPCFKVASSRGDRPWRGLAWMAVFLCEHGPYRDYDAHCTVRVVTRYVCCAIAGHCPN